MPRARTSCTSTLLSAVFPSGSHTAFDIELHTLLIALSLTILPAHITRAWWKARIVHSDTEAPTDVIFSSGAAFSCISACKVLELGLTTTLYKTPQRGITVAGGREFNTNDTAMITLELKTFVDAVIVNVASAQLDHVVLGASWFTSRKPEMDFRAGTMLVKDADGMEHNFIEKESYGETRGTLVTSAVF